MRYLGSGRRRWLGGGLRPRHRQNNGFIGDFEVKLYAPAMGLTSSSRTKTAPCPDTPLLPGMHLLPFTIRKEPARSVAVRLIHELLGWQSQTGTVGSVPKGELAS